MTAGRKKRSRKKRGEKQETNVTERDCSPGEDPMAAYMLKATFSTQRVLDSKILPVPVVTKELALFLGGAFSGNVGRYST